jgi:hypothetical protein
MSDHKQNLTDLAAMFAMMGMIARVQDTETLNHSRFIVEDAYDFAEELMIVREERLAGHSDDELDDEGIAAIKPKPTRRGGK